MGQTNFTPITPWVGGFQSITATSAAAVGLTISAVSAASAGLTQPNYALFFIEGVSARWRDDGTDPTPAVGMPVALGITWTYDGNLRTMKFITASGTAFINCALYRAGP